MPRRRPPRPVGPRLVVGQATEVRAGREWHVRRLTGATSGKPYTCPGCHRPIPAGTGHVVVWPVVAALLSASALDERRHWHTACWERS